jgi:hypothetical protein
MNFRHPVLHDKLSSSGFSVYIQHGYPYGYTMRNTSALAALNEKLL